MKLYPINSRSTGFCIRQTNLIYAVLLVLCILCISCDKEEPTQSTLSGVILDSNKKSMENVKVVLHTPVGKDSITTTENGAYTFPNLGHHTYSVTVSKTGYKQDEYLFMMDGKTNQSKNITMLSYDETAKFKVDPKTFTFDYKYNQAFTNITSNMAWSCADTVSWIDMLVLEGTGNKSVNFNVRENTTSSQRKAVIVFKSGYNKTDSLIVIQKASPGPYPTLIATNFNTDSLNVNKKMYLLFDQKVAFKSISISGYTLPASDLITESFADGKGIRFSNLTIPLCGNLMVDYSVTDVKAPERKVTGTFSLKTYTYSLSTSGIEDLTFNNKRNILWWKSSNSSTNKAYFKRLDLNASVPVVKSTECNNYYVQLAYNPAKDMIYTSYNSSNALYRYDLSTGEMIDSVKRSFTMPVNSFAFTKSGIGVFMTDYGFFAIETMNNNATKQLTRASIFRPPYQSGPGLVVDRIFSGQTDEVCIVTSTSSTWFGFINATGGNCYLNKPSDDPNTFSPTADGRYIMTMQSGKSIINPQTNASETLTNVTGLFATPTHFDNNSNTILTASGATLKLTNKSTNQAIDIRTYADGDIDNIIYPVNTDYFIIEKNSLYWIVKKSILKP